MTIASTTTRSSYNGDGSTTAFSTAFKFTQNSHVQVVLRSAAGVETMWVEGTDYTLTGAGNSNGGTVTATVAPAIGTNLVIIRVAPNTQGSSLPLGGSFPSTTVEEAIDLAAMRDQQLDEKIGRSLKFPLSDSSSLSADLPSSVDRANKYLAFDASSNPVATSGTSNIAVVSTFAETLLDDASASAARATLDVPSNAEAILDTLIDAKGDLIVGTAADTPARLAVGSNDQVLKADSTQTAGLAWGYSLQVPVRQTVLGGPVDSSGYPNFLPSTSANLNLTSQNITSSAPFVVTAANGFNLGGAVNRVGQSTANLTWTGLTASRAAATPNFLYVDIATDGTLTTGSTIIAPAYQFGGSYSTTANTFVFNRQEMVGKVGNGSAAVQTYRVFVGEAATDGTGVISTVSYAYQGKYRSAAFGVAVSTAYTQNHNIGVKPRPRLILLCNTADQNWVAGTDCDFSYSDNNGSGTIGIGGDAKVAYVTTGVNFYVTNRTTGALALPTYANWSFIVECDRGW